MSRDISLLTELQNCLSAYTETVYRILTSLVNTCDPSQNKHDSPMLIQIHDLISIDAELKQHLQRIEEWDKRQQRIEELEAELAGLNGRISQFTHTLTSSQLALQTSLLTAGKLQKGVRERRQAAMAESGSSRPYTQAGDPKNPSGE
jgi:hypothetical protein